MRLALGIRRIPPVFRQRALRHRARQRLQRGGRPLLLGEHHPPALVLVVRRLSHLGQRHRALIHRGQLDHRRYRLALLHRDFREVATLANRQGVVVPGGGGGRGDRVALVQRLGHVFRGLGRGWLLRVEADAQSIGEVPQSREYGLVVVGSGLVVAAAPQPPNSHRLPLNLFATRPRLLFVLDRQAARFLQVVPLLALHHHVTVTLHHPSFAQLRVQQSLCLVLLQFLEDPGCSLGGPRAHRRAQIAAVALPFTAFSLALVLPDSPGQVVIMIIQ